jgi:hypothetical protein
MQYNVPYDFINKLYDFGLRRYGKTALRRLASYMEVYIFFVYT